MISYLVALLSNYLGLAITIAIQVFLLPFLLNNLGPKLTGLYYLFMTISNFVAVGIGWLSGAGVYLLASSDSQREKINLQDVHWVVFLGFFAYATLILLIIVLAGMMAGNWWLRGAEVSLINEGRNACFLLGLYIWIQYIHQADISLFTAILQQGWANFYRIISQVVFATIVIFYILNNPRLDLLMLANLIGALVAAITARLHLRISGKLEPFKLRLPNSKLVKKMFVTKGGSYFIFGLAQFGLIYGDVLIIGAVLGSTFVSAYLVIWKIPEVIALLLGRISEILSPYLTRIDSGKGTMHTSLIFLCTSRLQHCLGIIAGLSYGIFGSSLVALWVGEANRPDVWWYYWVAGIVLFIQVVNRHDIILHYALAKLGRLVVPQFIELLLKVTLTLALFPSLGIAAPLVAALFIQVFGLTWIYRASALKQVNITWKDWFYKVGVLSCILLIVAGFCAFIIRLFIPATGLINFIISFSLFLILGLVSIILIERYQRQDGLFNLYKILSSV